MHPYAIANSLQINGFWFTYWSIRDTYTLTRTRVLWLIWIAHNYLKHRDEMLDNSVVAE
jgi:hypothetical protein